MRILVTGGAGYIGSVVSEYLLDEGHQVIIADDLSTGHRDAVDKRAEFFELNLFDSESLEGILADGIEAVCHFAAFSRVGESMANPLKYYRNNVCGAISLLDSMKRAGVPLFLFSSTAAVYGEPETIPITEDSSLNPVNPYGNTKLAVERLLEDCSSAWGLKSLSLRYFNAAGATELHGEDHNPESHLIPLVLDVVEGKREELIVFGDDYPTEDGTCIRDYIHVKDLATAHLLGLEKLSEGYSGALNLGGGRGVSVLEIVKAVSKVTGKKVNYTVGARRRGDPVSLVASSERAYSVLGWKRVFSEIENIIEDASNWRKNFPKGYRK
ncbi:MAG TPA: UDP-glucose 4-epimerase GalE [Candidatus Krumholzibacteriaceae bacterium]|nr:UDP-glucose 4-epimerase GalE [Candidatus Krumholzibacteriaceae bacterium]